MDLGTGIFLSTVVMSVVVLYGITRDRWNWRRLVKRTALVFLGLILLGVAGGGGVYLYNQFPPPVTRQSDYAGVRLGMSQDEVLYVRGYPPIVLAEEQGVPVGWLVLETNKLEKGKTVSDFRHWSYDEYKRNINIAFNDAKIVVGIQCYSDDKLGRCPPIAGIADGNHETKVLRTLGGDPRGEIRGTTKSLTYPELGVRFNLTREQVYSLEVSAPGYRR